MKPSGSSAFPMAPTSARSKSIRKPATSTWCVIRGRRRRPRHQPDGRRRPNSRRRRARHRPGAVGSLQPMTRRDNCSRRSFMDYAMPRADMLPSFTTDISQVLTPKNKLGVARRRRRRNHRSAWRRGQCGGRCTGRIRRHPHRNAGDAQSGSGAQFSRPKHGQVNLRFLARPPRARVHDWHDFWIVLSVLRDQDRILYRIKPKFSDFGKIGQVCKSSHLGFSIIGS